MGHNLEKGIFFCLLLKCTRDINLGIGGTRDCRRHQEMKLHKHSKRCGCTASIFILWDNKRGVFNMCRILFAYFLGVHHLAFQLGDRCTKQFKLMFPDSSIAKDFKCSRTKATGVLKVIAQDCWKTISTGVRETKYFSLQTDETTDITLTQQAVIMIRFFITPKEMWDMSSLP